MRISITGIGSTEKNKIFLDLLETSRKRPITRFENFLFTLLYADKIKCETEIVNSGNLLEIINADYTKSLAVSQRFLIDDLLGESIRFDKNGNKKEITNSNMY